LALYCPLLKRFQQLQEATSLGFHGPRQAGPAWHLLEGVVPPLVRDRTAYGSIRIPSVRLISGPLVGCFEAAANRLDGEGEPITLLRYAGCVLEYLQGMGRPLREVAHLGDVVEDLL
jgi:hypothetical protein